MFSRRLTKKLGYFVGGVTFATIGVYSSSPSPRKSEQWSFFNRSASTNQPQQVAFCAEPREESANADHKSDDDDGVVVSKFHSNNAEENQAPTVKNTEPELEIHTLQPPLLDDHHIAAKIPCIRPGRKNGVRTDIEDVVLPGGESANDKDGQKKKNNTRKVFHTYGFAGSGWSASVGVVMYQLSRFDALNVPINEPIAIIGSGAVGLFTSHFLLKRGYKHITVYTGAEDDLTSHRAAGVIDIGGHGNGCCSEDKQMLNTAAINTWKFFKNVLDGGVSGFSTAGVCAIPRYMGSRDLADDTTFYTENKLMDPPKDVLVRFREHGPLHKMCVVQGSLYLNVIQVMKDLQNVVFGDGTTWNGNEAEPKQQLTAQKKVCWVDDVNDVTNIPATTKYLFNCSGLGFNDKNMERVGVYTVQLKNQTFPEHVTERPDYLLIMASGNDYTIDSLLPGKKVSKIDEDGVVTTVEEPIKRKITSLTYFVPKQGIGLLGGDGIVVEENETFPPEPFDNIIKNCREIFYGFESDPFFKH